MTLILLMGAFYTVYGIASLFGFHNIPQKYRNRSWSCQYAHSCGIMYLMKGVLWVLLYIIASLYEVNLTVVLVLYVLFAIPSILYGMLVEKKYKAKLLEESKQL